MNVYYIQKATDVVKECGFPVKKGDLCLLLHRFEVKTIYIDSNVEDDSIWRDFRFLDTKSLKGTQFPQKSVIICRPLTNGTAEGDTATLQCLINACTGEWLKDFLVETQSVLNGFNPYWDLKSLQRFTRDEDLKEERDFAQEVEEKIGFVRVEEKPSVKQKTVSNLDSQTGHYRYLIDFCLQALVDFNPEMKERDMKILQAILRGQSLEEVAQDFMLTRERIRQLFVQYVKETRENRQRTAKEFIRLRKENRELQKNINLHEEDGVGLAEHTVSHQEYNICNYNSRCAICRADGTTLFSDKGSMKEVGGIICRCRWKAQCFTVKTVKNVEGRWLKSEKLIVAYPSTALYEAVDPERFINEVEDFREGKTKREVQIKYHGVWYDRNGRVVQESIGECVDEDNHRHALSPKQALTPVSPPSSPASTSSTPTVPAFVPSGRLKYIHGSLTDSYDYFCMMAIIDLLREMDAESKMTYDEIACMAIANVWEMAYNIPNVMDHEERLMECIRFLQKNADKEVKTPLDWSTPKYRIYEVLKDFPMYGVFEEVVDELTKSAPYNLLKAWFDDDPQYLVIEKSQAYDAGCLFAIFPRKYDPHIVMNPSWKRHVTQNHGELLRYFAERYIDFIGASEDNRLLLDYFMPHLGGGQTKNNLRPMGHFAG